MRLAAVALVALVGCGNSVGDDAPIYGGGGGGGDNGSMGGDGGMTTVDSNGDGGNTVNGRVCIVADARLLTTSCKNSEGDGLLVTLASYMARTTADGSFQITPGGDSTTLWHVTSDAQSTPDILPSLQQVSLTNTISAFSTTAYDTLLDVNGAEQVDGTGGVFLRITHDGAPQSGVLATTTQSMYVFYDNNASGVQWQTSAATSTNGVVWIPGAVPDASGNVAVALTPASGAPIDATVKVVPGSLTFATVSFP